MPGWVIDHLNCTDKENYMTAIGVISEFCTTDLPLASFLKINGYKLIELRQKGMKGEFVFKDIPRQLLNDYNADGCSVEPKMFSSVMRQMVQSAKRFTSTQQ